MITRYKLFESKDNPEVGDYVLVNKNPTSNDFYRLLNKSIGKIVGIDLNNLFGAYTVDFQDILEYTVYNLPMNRDEIRSFSKDRKKLELELEAEKYNM